MTTRIVPWVYFVVLVAGVYFALIGPDVPVGRTIAFVGAMAALFAVLAVKNAPGVVLGVNVVLFGLAALTDGSGLSRALFVLVPFTVYLTYGRRAGIVAAGLCLAAITAALAPGLTDPEPVSDLLMFVIGLVLALAMAGVARAEQEARLRLEESHAQVAELSAAAERNRLARDIHDSLGHHLTAITVQLEKADAFRVRDPSTATAAVDAARHSARAALDDVRRSVRALRTDLRLTEALRDLVAQHGPAVTLMVDGDERDTDQNTRTAIYRAAQEALTNASRHADARTVRVAVAFTGARARLEVADDGRGMPADTGEGFGLLGMRERVALVGGAVRVESGERGTTVTVTVPR